MRQFILEKQKIVNGLITLDGKDFRYLRQVLRVKAGDMVNVRTTDGRLLQTTAAKIDDKAKKITLQICGNCDLGAGGNCGDGGLGLANGGDSFANVGGAGVASAGGVASVAGKLAESSTSLVGQDSVCGIRYVLMQFLPRPTKFELIVRQATECGVSLIIPVIGEYSEESSARAISGAKKERLEKIIKEARQQSGSPIATKVAAPVKLEEAVKLLEPGSLNLALYERNQYSENLNEVLNKAAETAGQSGGLAEAKKPVGTAEPPIKQICVAVGSEGGISPAEIDFLREKGLFHTLHFAVNILRCETAALYGMAAVQSAASQLKTSEK